MREQQTATKLAQIDSMIGIFNSATPLDQYSALLKSQLHSGGPPLHVKAKAIKDHKELYEWVEERVDVMVNEG